MGDSQKKQIDMFSREVYRKRRSVLLDRMKGQGGLALFMGNSNSPAQGANNAYPFRQDSGFLYYFGLDVPDLAATLDLDSGEAVIYGDDLSLDDIIWTGPMPSVREMAESVGVFATAPAGDLEAVLARARNAGRQVHFLPTARTSNALKMGALLGRNPHDFLPGGKAGSPTASTALVRAVISQRLVKGEEEIASIDAACDAAFEMHTVARESIRPGASERDIFGRMADVASARGWGFSFQTILTEHGEIFHCTSRDARLTPGRLALVDAGLESDDHYASDFTRTYPVSGRFTPRQRDIYKIVCDCHDLAFELAAPGVSYYDVHNKVAARMLEDLSALGLVGGGIDDMLENGIAGLFLPHGLGHNMGLDDHDMEDYGEDLVGYDPGQSRSTQPGLGSLRMARKLVPGNVVTDEPGIYFIPELIALWKADGLGRGFVNFSKLEEYLDFGGIRLEDDLLITDTGVRRLGRRRLPATPEEIEDAMN